MQKIAQLVLTFFILILIAIGTPLIATAQVAINEDSSNPDASAMLDISSTDKGLLIPRMDSTARKNITNPASGLMVYDSTTNSFWYFEETAWTEIGGTANLAFTSENGITAASNLNDDFLFGDETKEYGGSDFETKLFFDNENGALRAGINWNDNWDQENLGYGSIALGDSPLASNTGSIAFGSNARATGYHAISLGYQNESSGNYSATFGAFTYTTGVNATAMGLQTRASSYVETVIGMNNTSASSFSKDSFRASDRLFVIGNGQNSGNRSDAMIVYKSGDTEINGKLTIDGAISADNLAFTSENGITAASNNDDDFIFGADTLNYGTGRENKFFFDKATGAFRAGGIESEDWNQDSLGEFSVAMGLRTKATGSYSFAAGIGSIASGRESIAMGTFSEATGTAAVALGNVNKATGIFSFAQGNFAVATGSGSSAIGSEVTSEGNYSAARGFRTTSYSFVENVIGMNNTIYTPLSKTGFEAEDRLFVIGNGTSGVDRSDAMIVYKSGNTEINGKLTIDGAISADNLAFTSENGITAASNSNDDFVFGADSLNYGFLGTENKFFFHKNKGAFRAGGVNSDDWNIANLGDYSFAAGFDADARGAYSISMGFMASSGGVGSISIGTSTGALQDYATAIGNQATASGISSIAIGNSSALGNQSVTIGSDNLASGLGANALGTFTTASGNLSTTFGLYTTAPSYVETVIGQYNTDYTPNAVDSYDTDDRLFVIGNGMSTLDRSDAMIVYKNGNTAINGSLTIDGDISANNLAFVSNNGVAKASNITDDFLVGDQTLNYGGTGTERKMYFDQGRGALRAGYIGDSDWNSSNVGTASVALGYGALANKDYAVALGFETESVGAYAMATGFRSRAAGQYAVAMGLYNYARSYGEVAIGTFNTDVPANNTNSFNAADRLFVIGNGTANNARSDAFIIYKSGNTRINGSTTFNGNLLGANGTVIVNDNLRVNGDIVSNNGIVTVNDELLVKDDFKVEGEKIGENNFIAIFENTTDDNSDQNDGVQIIAGHTSYDSDYQSGFLRFVRPDGQQCGRVRQEGGGSVRYATSSDIRLKENIQPTQYGLADILNIQVRDYNFINDKKEYQQTGFLAQQLYTIFPTAVEVGGNDVKNDPWTVDYGSLTPLLVKGMQDQQETIKDLKSEIEDLKIQVAKIKRLEAILEALQAEVK